MRVRLVSLCTHTLAFTQYTHTIFLCVFLLPLTFGDWGCAPGQCSVRKQIDWSPSSFECVSRPAEELAVRLVPYQEEHWLRRWRNLTRFPTQQTFPDLQGVSPLTPVNVSGSHSASEGLVQIYRYGAWHPACTGPGYADKNSAARNQTCKQLGYQYSSYLVFNDDMHKELCQMSERGVVIGKCVEGEKIGQCTGQFNWNGFGDVCPGGKEFFENWNWDKNFEGWDCSGEVAIRCSNHKCLDTNVNQHFPFQSWQNCSQVRNATFLYYWDPYATAEQRACECMLACLVASAGACGLNRRGCYAGSDVIPLDDNSTCNDGSAISIHGYLSRTITSAELDLDWNLPESVPNVTSIPEPCVISSLAVRFYGSAIYSVNVEDGPMRQISQGILNCLFLDGATIVLTNASILECEWRVEFFFAANETARQSEVLARLENYSTSPPMVAERLVPCLDRFMDNVPNLDVKFALQIFRANVQNDRVQLHFDDRWPDAPCSTTTSVTTSKAAQESTTGRRVSSLASSTATPVESSLAQALFSFRVGGLAMIMAVLWTFAS